MTAPQLAPATVVAQKYQVGACLGYAGSSATYQAIGTDGREVVLKIFDPAIRQRADIMSAIEQTYAATNALPQRDRRPPARRGLRPGTGAPFSVSERIPIPSLAADRHASARSRRRRRPPCSARSAALLDAGAQPAALPPRPQADERLRRPRPAQRPARSRTSARGSSSSSGLLTRRIATQTHPATPGLVTPGQTTHPDTSSTTQPPCGIA